jgi:AraC family transcriptional regulator
MADTLPYAQADTANGVVLRLLPRGAYSVRYTPSQPVAGFAFDSQHGLHAFGSDRVRAFRAAAHGLAFTPAGCSVFSEAAEGGEYLTLTGNQERLAALGGSDDGRGLPHGQFTGRVHQGGVRAAHALRRLLLSGKADPAALESALASFLAALHSAAGGPNPTQISARSLTPQRLKIVEDLIEARLAEPLAITDMAAACRLSTGFFLRAFKAAVGQTPHRFLMGRRVAAARAALRDTRSGAAEIAVMTGFCSQAHMTVCFRNSMGVTPGAYRAAVTHRKTLPMTFTLYSFTP